VIIGTSQVDITPEVGAELSGFARRIQPSTGILDRLYARGLYLEQDGERLLWFHADLIAVGRELVLEFRQWARQRWGLDSLQVMISATHTHSGPATITVQEAGAYDAKYVAYLRTRLELAAEAAMGKTEPCDVVTLEGRLDLAVDRRGKATPHTDPRVGGVGFRRRNGGYTAVIVNYPMHAVALGPTNRLISADVPGRAAVRLSGLLPGHPIALITNGACGNLNPPFENVPSEQIDVWGGQVADAVAGLFGKAAPVSNPVFRTLSRVVPLPLDALSVDEIEAYAAHIVGDPASQSEWAEKFRRAVDNWRRTMIAAVREGTAGDTRDAELFAVRIGDVALLGMNAEVFSRFTDDVRESTGRKLYVVGYANGDMGYIPTRAAYDEGGYEVEIAHLFYCNFRPKAGGLELLAQHAADIVQVAFAKP
jgi:neutral ceramidase